MYCLSARRYSRPVLSFSRGLRSMWTGLELLRQLVDVYRTLASPLFFNGIVAGLHLRQCLKSEPPGHIRA